MYLITHTLKTSKNTLKKANIPSRSWLDRTVSPKTPGNCNPFDLYFGVSTLQNKTRFKQKQGSSGFQVHQPLLSNYQFNVYRFLVVLGGAEHLYIYQLCPSSTAGRRPSVSLERCWMKLSTCFALAKEPGPMISIARITWKTHTTDITEPLYIYIIIYIYVDCWIYSSVIAYIYIDFVLFISSSSFREVDKLGVPLQNYVRSSRYP